MGWSQSYKQGSEEGRGEWARAGRQRPRWRGREGLESGVLGPGRPLLLFQKASARAFSSSHSRCLSLSRLPPHPRWPVPGPCLPLQTGQDSKFGLPGPTKPSPEAEIPKAWSPGAKNAPPTHFHPVLDLSESPSPTALRLFRTPGPSASRHCVAR